MREGANIIIFVNTIICTYNRVYVQITIETYEFITLLEVTWQLSTVRFQSRELPAISREKLRR